MRAALCKIALLLLLLLLVFFTYESFAATKKTDIKSTMSQEEEKDQTYMVSLTQENGEVKTLELETYLEGVVASEMPYTFEMEALKAQCVASRTFVLQRNLQVDTTTTSQVYKSQTQLQEIHQDSYDEMHAKIKQALQETKGEVLTYEGQYISALFYSSSNGKTNDASWYYKNEVPYLKSVDSHWDLDYEKTKQSVEKSEAECMDALGVNDMTQGVVSYYDNGYVKEIEIGGKVFTGREVREALQLRSSCFSYSVQNGSVLFVTTGFGHGVGMSQYGAQSMAKEGASYQDILKHYYSGVSIEKR